MPAVRRAGQHAGGADPDREAGRGQRGRNQGVRCARRDEHPRGQGQRREGGPAAAHEGRPHPRCHRRPPGLEEHRRRARGRFVAGGRPASRATSSSGTAATRTARREIELRDVAEAALAGWMQSDGFVGQYDGHEPFAHDRGDDGHRRRARVGHERAGHTCSPTCTATSGRSRPQSATLDCRRTRLYGKHLGDFVEPVGSARPRHRDGRCRRRSSTPRCRWWRRTCAASSRRRATCRTRARPRWSRWT